MRATGRSAPIATTCLVILAACSSRNDEPCIPHGTTGSVVVVTETVGRTPDESHQISIRRNDGMTTTCLGGADAGRLRPGDVTDGLNMHGYPLGGTRHDRDD